MSVMVVALSTVFLLLFASEGLTPPMVMRTNEVVVEARAHTRLVKESGTRLATVVYRVVAPASATLEEAVTDPRVETWATIYQDDARDESVFTSSYRDLEEDVEIHQLIVRLAQKDVLEVRVEYHPGIDAKIAADMWRPTEYGVPDPSYFKYEINGKIWEFRTHDVLVDGSDPVQEGIHSLGLRPQDSVLDVLRRMSESFQHAWPAPRTAVFPNNIVCRDFMPVFVREQCVETTMPGEAQWELMERNCNFDSSLGLPCHQGVVDFESKGRDLVPLPFLPHKCQTP